MNRCRHRQDAMLLGSEPDTEKVLVQSDGHVICVVDARQALLTKARALKDLRDSWQHSTAVRVAMAQLRKAQQASHLESHLLNRETPDEVTEGMSLEGNWRGTT